MQKTTTLKDLKVFLLKPFLSILVLSMSFLVSFAQEGALTKPASAKQGFPTEKPAGIKVSPAVAQKKAAFKTASSISAQSTDVPALNKAIAAKYSAGGAPEPNPILPNGVAAVCTFNGSLGGADLTLTSGRFFRDGISSTCAAPKGVCPGSFATGACYYDTYTMQNLTCASQCVTVTYLANGAAGNAFVTAYSGTFNPASLCTNYIADGGSSSLAAGTPVTFSFTLAASQTVVLVVNEAVAGEACEKTEELNNIQTIKNMCLYIFIR